MRLTPSASVSWVRNTAALFCMMRCMSRRIDAVVRLPLACLQGGRRRRQQQQQQQQVHHPYQAPAHA